MPQSTGDSGQEQKIKGLYRNLFQRHGQEIFERLQQDDFGRTFGDTPEEVFEKFASFDPTADRRHKPYGYLNWLCKAFIDSYKEGGNPVDAHQLSTIAYDLEIFNENKQRFPQGTPKDIFQYTPGKLSELVIEITGEDRLSASAMKRRLSKEMRSQSKIIYDGPEGMIVMPQTLEAAVYWGQGSKWCTAGNDAASHYKNYPNLVVYLPSNVDAHSMEVGFSKYQGCDTYNALYHAQNSAVTGLPANLKKLVTAALQKDPGLYKLFRTSGSIELDWIPDEFRTKETWLEEVDIIKENIVGKIVPLIPDEVWQVAGVPEKIAEKTYAALAYIPEEYRSPQVYILALKKADDSNYDSVLKSIPDGYWGNKEFRHEVADERPYAYRYCPKRFLDSHICLVGLSKEGPSRFKSALDFMPDKIWKDDDFRRKFMDIHWTAFKFCPQELRDRYMCEKAIEGSKSDDYDVLGGIPEKIWQDKEFFEFALAYDWNAFKYGCEEWRDTEKCLQVLTDCDEDRDEVVKLFPDAVMQDRKFRHAAADLHWGFIRFCPPELQDNYISMRALVLSREFERQEALKSIAPHIWQDRTFCETAYAYTKDAFDYMPEEIQKGLFPEGNSKNVGGEQARLLALEDVQMMTKEETNTLKKVFNLRARINKATKTLRQDLAAGEFGAQWEDASKAAEVMLRNKIDDACYKDEGLSQEKIQGYFVSLADKYGERLREVFENTVISMKDYNCGPEEMDETFRAIEVFLAERKKQNEVRNDEDGPIDNNQPRVFGNYNHLRLS